MHASPDGAVLRTQDGLALVADVHHPDDAPDGAAVVVHGFTGSRRNAAVRAQAVALRDAGLAVVVPDLRGHGDSPGACTLGHFESLDVGAAVELARGLHPHVVLVGASMGAISVLRYAADHHDIAGVVAVSGPSAWKLPRTPVGLLAAALSQTRLGRAVARRHLGVTVAPGFSYAAPPVELVTRVTTPLAIVHGAADRMIPLQAARELQAAATGPHSLHIVERMGHAFEEFGRATVTTAAAWVLAYGAQPGVATA